MLPNGIFVDFHLESRICYLINLEHNEYTYKLYVKILQICAARHGTS